VCAVFGLGRGISSGGVDFDTVGLVIVVVIVNVLVLAAATVVVVIGHRTSRPPCTLILLRPKPIQPNFVRISIILDNASIVVVLITSVGFIFGDNSGGSHGIAYIAETTTINVSFSIGNNKSWFSDHYGGIKGSPLHESTGSDCGVRAD